jgi:NAD-dependent deacetylase
MTKEVILQVAGEGGSYSLFGEKNVTGWSFYFTRNEFALEDLLDEDDDDIRKMLHHKSRSFKNIEEALNQLGRGWPHIVPKIVHPLFALPIWSYLLDRQKERGNLDLRRWEQLLIDENLYYSASELMQHANRVVILTGAGMSTEAGIPDFRSPSGWWNKMDPRKVATVEALETNYDLFHSFYSYRIEQLDRTTPHRGHELIAQWEHSGKVTLVATQNVDGLHQLAGCSRVQELHGSILTYRCHSCCMPTEKYEFLEKHLCSCGGRLRPNVVLFGESLPQEAWNQAVNEIEQADLVLVIGTSLLVSPVNQLPYLTEGKRVLINKELTGKEQRFDVVIQGQAVDSLESINEWLNRGV